MKSSTIISAALALIAVVSTARADGARVELYPAAMPVMDGDGKITVGIDVTASLTPFRSPAGFGEGIGVELQVGGTYFPQWDASLIRATAGLTIDGKQRAPRLGPFGGAGDGHVMIGPTVGRFWRDGSQTVVGATFASALRFVRIGGVTIDGYLGFTLLLARGTTPSDQPSRSIFGIIDGVGVRFSL